MRAAAVVCERECRGMLETLYAARGSSARERMGLLDRVSQRLCETVDRAELLRCVHPAEETRREADAVFEVLSHLIATLNTSEQLHAACVAICSDGAGTFGEEERRVADTYRSELEAHGVHLGASVRQAVVELQGSIGALSHRFAGGEGAALAPLLNARRELARLLGHASYAEYVLPSRVLGSVGAVETLLNAMEALPPPAAKRQRRLSEAPEVSLEQALAALQGLSRELFGLETSEASDFPNQWHGSVRCLEAGPRGAIYLDLLQRPGKVPQPCTFQLQFDVGNSRSAQSRNVCAVVASIGDPRSLTPYEVESLFHEWGHAMASVLSATQYQQLAGTRAALDWVEAPSMLLERLAWHPLALPRHANVSRVEAMRQQWRAHLAAETSAQLTQARQDLRLHSASFDAPRHSPFVHLGPYGAGYYSYLVCKVFAANLERHCLGPGLGGGARLRDGLLRHGGARDPLAMMRECTGRDPFDLAALHD